MPHTATKRWPDLVELEQKRRIIGLKLKEFFAVADTPR